MNRGLIGIVVLGLVAVLAAFFVINSKSKTNQNLLGFYEMIPSNFTEEIIEMKQPNRLVEDLLNSNLIWKELDENKIDLEDFWNSTDSQFNELKIEAKSLLYFNYNKENYFLLELEKGIDSVSKKKGYTSFVLNNFVLYSKADLRDFKKKFEEETPIGEHNSFASIKERKNNSKDGVNLYKKKYDNWNIHEITFLPEQIFSSSNVNITSKENRFSGQLDFSVFDFLPARFHSIKIIQSDSLMISNVDEETVSRLSEECGCDAQFSLFGWMKSPVVNFVPMEDSNEIVMVKARSLAGFLEGMKDLKTDSVLFSEENGVINFLSEGLALGDSKLPFKFVLRIDDFIYFGRDKSQLEKLNFRIFSGLTMSSSEQVYTFIKNNISKGAYSISIHQGLDLGLIKSKKGLSLYQEKKQTKELDYVSFIYSQELEIGKGMVNPKWIKSFSTELKNRIYKVKNHRTNDHNYIIQDKNNVIYFMSPNGEIVWSRGLENPIVGEIKNIDLFGNQKYQLIFNTYNQLFLMDILGRNVGDFPVTIKDSATGNVSVMDYDKDLNFRFLVPTKAGIKSVNAQGKLVDGWLQPNPKSEVSKDIEHLLINNLDYILVRGNSHQSYFYNRKGEERHKVMARFGEPFFLFQGSSIRNTRAIFLDSNENTICRQFFDDKPVSILLSPQKRITQFFFVDYDQNQQKDFVLVFADEVVVYGQDLIIKERIALPIAHKNLKVWEEGISYINEINELVINIKGKNHLIEKVQSYELDFVKNRLRVLVKYRNDLKLLHLQ